MFKKLFQKKLPVLPDLPANQRLYCVGDIHGRNDLLVQIHEQILADQSGYQGTTKIIYVGDYVDRGFESKQVIELLAKDNSLNEQSVFIRGNHEQALLDFLVDDTVGPAWFSFGGQTTLLSYDVPVAKIPTKRQDYIDIQCRLKANMPETHLLFLRKTIRSYQEGAYFFAHAGINPKLPLFKQNYEDLMWIREEFTESNKIYEKIIVHGHTVSDEPEFKINRIGIDTGAYASGVLTCLVLEGQQHRLIQTGSA